MFIWEKNFKYLKAQQVSQQISIFFKSKFHNEGGDCQKSYFEVFCSQGSHMSPPKISTLADAPLTFLPIFPRFLTNIRCRYFSSNIWVVYQQIDLYLGIFDPNWAKSRLLHFQLFHFPNATNREYIFFLRNYNKENKQVGLSTLLWGSLLLHTAIPMNAQTFGMFPL